MIVPPVCLLYTQDQRLTRRAFAFLEPVAEVRHVGDLRELLSALEQYSPALLVLELNADGVPHALPDLVKERTQDVIIVIGVPRSEPARRAEALGVYSVEPAEIDRRHFQATVRQATAYLRLSQENTKLQEDLQATETRMRQQPPPSVPANPTEPLLHFARAFRSIEDLPSVLDNIVEGVAAFGRVARAGIFVLDTDRNAYKLRASRRCAEDTSRRMVPRESPLVRWLELHAHAVTQDTLKHEEQTSNRVLLRQSLDALGAEALIPLYGRDRLIGWIFLGKHVTGEPLSKQDMEQLMFVADTASLTVENALLYAEVRLQKTLAETVLHAVPIGIVAIDASRIVRWYNTSAAQILGLPRETVLNQPVSRLGSRLSDLLCKCLETSVPTEPVEWRNGREQRPIAVDTRRLSQDDEGLGAVAIVRDLTSERLMREKQKRVERATFWTELAAVVSHEVRNPLVAINTFAQLLPERYDDPEFRTEFSKLATSEIERLDRMIDQIEAFANPPPDLVFDLLNIEDVLHSAISHARKGSPESKIDTKLIVETPLPAVRGNKEALDDCFRHLIVNAMEALKKADNGRVRIVARQEGQSSGKVTVEVKDNAGGIPLKLREKVFSPFCTSKARGIGLGLPIARRTVADHGGTIDFETDDSGTCVRVALPCRSLSDDAADGPTIDCI